MAKQIKQVVPRYRALDDTVLERNVLTLMRGVQTLVTRQDDGALLMLVRDTAHIRTLSGFDGADLLMAGMCFLTVLRRFLAQMVQPLDEALRTYDALEALAIPFFGRLGHLFQAMGQDALVTDADVDVQSLLGRTAPKMVPVDLGLPED